MRVVLFCCKGGRQLIPHALRTKCVIYLISLHPSSSPIIQTVLYNMFDWPTRAGSRLSIIGIANTMDLPERLHPRIGSRLAGRRLPFQPYGRDQLETILRARLEGIDAFEPSALVLVSRRVANCSGDIRLALEICARCGDRGNYAD